MTEPPTFPPEYRPTLIAACPECLSDTSQEGRDGFHCQPCDRTWTFQEVAYLDETDYDRD